MGLEPVNRPEYSYIANVILSAYNTIARSRGYSNGVPSAISSENIKSYLEMNDLPCHLHIFVDCIFAIDNIYLDDAFKKLKRKK